jgi:TolB-like protein
MRLRSVTLFSCMIAVLMLPVAGAEPSTRPAVASTQPGVSDLYLIPFSALGGDNSLDWAGKAVQQNLLTDIARAKFHVIPAEKPIAVIADAQSAAKAAGAKTIITGTYQVADTLVRFNGQIIDAATGNVLGGISATGAPRDLFTMEDSLSAQVLSQLGSHNAVAVNNKPLAPGLQQPVVIQIIQPPAVAQVGNSSSYEGSALQQYVDSNRTPSTDYAQQLQNAEDRDTYGYGYNSIYGNYLGGYGYGYGFGGYGLGYGVVYSISSGGYRPGFAFGDHHHGRFDNR